MKCHFYRDLEAANQTLASAAKLAARENVPDHSDQTVAFPASVSELRGG